MRIAIAVFALWFVLFTSPLIADDLTAILVAAEDDNAMAQVALGAMYEHGMGVARNDTRSAYWWQRALDNGYMDIAKALGSMYFSGRGVPLDYKKAMELYAIAAEHGQPHAIKYIALGYKRGLGLPQDDAKAEEWAQKAAALEGADSAVVMLESYQSKETEPHTDKELFDEFLKQAEKGNPRGHYYVSVAYTAGVGVPQDYVEAEKWARRAAETGLTSGAAHLGLFHQLGQGVPINRVEAQKWYYVVAGLRPDDDPFLSLINGSRMNEQELAEARTLADQWLASR